MFSSICDSVLTRLIIGAWGFLTSPVLCKAYFHLHCSGWSHGLSTSFRGSEDCLWPKTYPFLKPHRQPEFTMLIFFLACATQYLVCLWLANAASFGQQLLMFDAQDGRFHCIKLRAKQTGCVVCGEMPMVTELQDYESFCGSSATDKVRIVSQSNDSDQCFCCCVYSFCPSALLV